MITAQDAFNIVTEFKNYSEVATTFIQTFNQEIVDIVDTSKKEKTQIFEHSRLVVLNKKDLEDVIGYYEALGYDVICKGSQFNLYKDRIDLNFIVKWDKNPTNEEESTDENA